MRLIVGIQVKYPHKVVDLSCADSMADIAESLDVDAPTQATCNEFCGGMVQITCCSEALDIVRVMTMLMFARQETRSVTHRCTATVAPPAGQGAHSHNAGGKAEILLPGSVFLGAPLAGVGSRPYHAANRRSPPTTADRPSST